MGVLLAKEVKLGLNFLDWFDFVEHMVGEVYVVLLERLFLVKSLLPVGDSLLLWAVSLGAVSFGLDQAPVIIVRHITQHEVVSSSNL